MHRRSTILDSDKRTPLYTITANSGGIFSSKPHMTILNAATGAPVGTVTFHSMSSDIDIQIHGRDMSFDKPKVFSSAHQFHSLAVGQAFSWKKDGMFSGGDLKCVDGSGQECAFFESSNWALSKDGKIELAPTIQGPFMDEIVVTGIAAIENQRRQNARSSGGGGGA